MANNGVETLEALKKDDTFDLVLMDVQMPEMDGLEATREIRKREKESGGHIRIVAMTADVMKGDRELCIAAGMDGFVAKPLRSRLLYDAVEATDPAGQQAQRALRLPPPGALNPGERPEPAGPTNLRPARMDPGDSGPVS